MPVIISNVGYSSVVGVAMHKLREGLTYNQTIAYLREVKRFADLPLAGLRRSASEALRNVKAEQRTGATPTKGTVGSGFQGTGATPRVVGLRIAVQVRLSDGTTATRSVLVNAPSGTSFSRAIGAGLDWASQTNFGKPRAFRYRAEMLSWSIIGIYEGGLQNPHVEVR